MKRYIIFGLLGPFIGGFLLLIVMTTLSGYWSHTDASEVKMLFKVFFSTLQYSYLFGIVPVLMVAAIDDIFCHIKPIGAVARMLIIGAIGFLAAGLIYGGRGAEIGAKQFCLYGLVGLVPALLASWLSHKAMAHEDAARRQAQAATV
jgi:uncharacterized protein DUF5413